MKPQIVAFLNFKKNVTYFTNASSHRLYHGFSGYNSKTVPKDFSICGTLKVDFKTNMRGWRDGSVVKSTDSSSEGPEFKSQQPHGG